MSIYSPLSNSLFTLDAGCGHKKLGTINVDLNKSTKPDIVCSINNLPFRENLFNIVFCHEVLEHKGVKPRRALQELLRVSKQFVDITVPHWLGSNAHKTVDHANWEVMHKRFWNYYAPLSMVASFEFFKFFPLLSKPSHYHILLRKLKKVVRMGWKEVLDRHWRCQFNNDGYCKKIKHFVGYNGFSIIFHCKTCKVGEKIGMQNS
jgi:SAM-dependent methyltransferase